MKILIVDDDFVVRQGIIHSIDWQSNGLFICGEAANGREGFEKVQKLMPEIVITDIKMPVEDGLKLSERISEAYPYIKIVILTGYNDFAYARQGLKLGVREYLLKPVNADELLRAVVALRDEINREKCALDEELGRKALLMENNNLIRDRLLSKLVNGALSASGTYSSVLQKLETLGIRLNGPHYKVLLIAVDDFLLLTQNSTETEKEALISQIRTLIEGELERDYRSAVFLNEYSYFIAILNCTGLPVFYEREMIMQVRRLVHERLCLTVTTTIGTERASLFEIPASYREAVYALRRRPYRNGDCLIEYEPSMVQGGETIFEIKNEETALVQKLRTYRGEEIKDILCGIFQEAARIEMNFQQLKTTCIRLIMITISNLEEMSLLSQELCGGQFDPLSEIEKYETIHSLEQWMQQFFHEVGALLHSVETQKYKAVVKKAIQFVEKNYQSKIKIEDVVREIFVTPNYFSQVFKSQTGMNFTDYVNQFRVEKAKILLWNLDLKIYHVAEQVGYQEYKYFNFIFKKYVGYSPKEYRNNLCPKGGRVH